MRQQKSWMALVALLFLFAACKGESPTAPPVGGGTGGGGGTGTPQTGVNVTLTASNANPVVDSIVTITAVVTIDGQPAPNGTAVEFAATGGSFSATEIVTSVLRTTTNGAATVELRSTVAGSIRVQATVGSVSRTVDVLYRVSPTIPPPTTTAPSITQVTPAIGIPSGGERIAIIGKNFKEPVRVLFDTGAAQPIEAFVVSVTDTRIEVLTPSVNLGAGQQLVADLIVLTQAGTATEQRATFADAFTFRNEQLTPRITTASPNSGPVTGGTRVTLFGDGFQAPVQVLFGSAEARVILVEFGQIIVETPAARDTTPNGSGTFTGPVAVTVRNINSQTEVTLSEAFRFVAAIDITSFRPLTGPATGGTDVVIDGIGFLAPVDVTIAGIRATVLQVTGSRILARTAGLPSACSGGSGGVRVVNVNNGDTETFTDEIFTYVPVTPLITSVESGQPGEQVTVVVRDPGVGALGIADIRFTINGRTIIPTPDRITAGAGLQNFEVTLPLTGFTFPTIACEVTPGGLQGTQFGPAEVPITFTNIATACTANTTVVVTPNPLTNPCLAPPEGTVSDIDPEAGGCAAPAPTGPTGATTFADIDITNRPNSQALNITGVSVTGPNASSFTVTPTTATNIPGGSTRTFTVAFNPPDTPVPAADTPQSATVTFTTNSPTIPTISVCVNSTIDVP
ncbi:MAG TPA: IPT/TIG domain-containing protein [Thermoanaerobaculia bacterium]|nr:IPT/TIG domain-containing protein [Thermoanaerobaculia bacterium]